MSARYRFACVAVVIAAGLASVWFSPLPPSAPRELIWQNSIYSRSGQRRLEPALAATLEPHAIDGGTLWLRSDDPLVPNPPLRLYLPAGDGRYWLYEWSRFQAEDELLVRKPNIYLYSQEPLAFRLQLQLNGRLTASEPAYLPAGWAGVAYADGMIDRNVPYLFYEFTTAASFVTDQGWCVAGAEFPQWCERELAGLGLNARERDDFCAYWSQALPDSGYVNIYLQPQALPQRVSALRITPAPDALLRLWFYFVPTPAYRPLVAPQSPQFERRGFTLVEWGGVLAAAEPEPKGRHVLP